MTTTANNNTNNQPGRQRRSLNDTIGRLDEMIDGLSEAIPGTIRDTLQETVGAAVAESIRAALADNLANPELLALLRGSLTPPPLAVAVSAATADPGLLRKLLAAARAVSCGAALVVHKFEVLRQRLVALRKARRPLLVALAVGGLAALVASVAPNWVAALLSGVGGAGVTLAAQVGLWLRRRLGHLPGTGD